MPAETTPSLDADLLAILACPSEDHAPLEQAGQTLVCTNCGSAFPIRDGIPVLLVDDAVPGPNGIGRASGASSSASAGAPEPAAS